MKTKLFQKIGDALDSFVADIQGEPHAPPSSENLPPPEYKAVEEHEIVALSDEEYTPISTSLKTSDEIIQKLKALAMQYEVMRSRLLIEAFGQDQELQDVLKKLRETHNIPADGGWTLHIPSETDPDAYFFYQGGDDVDG
jgi:hypothetical protein